MNKDALKEEYEYWKQTIKKAESLKDGFFRPQKEQENYMFAKGFVSAVDKSGVLED